MTALRFPDASVTGIDLWRTIDQSGNSEVAARTNAAANRVQSRLALVTGDMISLPFEDGAFDLVTAGLSIHNIPTVEGRAAALREGVRVLAEGGQLIIIDIRRAPEYAQQLRELGLDVSGPDRLGWRGWWTGPWIASSIVRATK
jgi:ubiquinone/menaquinone biosynthesis C-methylase UbiE